MNKTGILRKGLFTGLRVELIKINKRKRHMGSFKVYDKNDRCVGTMELRLNDVKFDKGNKNESKRNRTSG